MKRIFLIAAFLLLFVSFIASCATTQGKPLAYLALEKPKEAISTTVHKEMKLEFPRGGFYFFNYNFRPAADIKAYIQQAEKEANTKILRNTDIQLNIPFAFDILFFGYNGSTDYLTITK